jgi:hypothetical protein
MRFPVKLVLTLITFTSMSFAVKKDHVWLIGRILDNNEVSHYAGTVNNSSATATAYGNSAYGNSYGSSAAIYRVYDTLTVEGETSVYLTSERLKWRWSKGPHVAVNSEIKYYVEGRKLHVLDQDGKEHTADIVKEIVKTNAPPPHAPLPAQNVVTTVSVSITSTPVGADIEVDGSFVGSTPSTLTLSPGHHSVAMKKKGFTDWNRDISVSSGNINISAELEPKS